MENETQGNAYDYLYATIMMADWIASDYKQLAEKYRRHPAIKELYMCICDNVNLDLLELISIDDDAPALLEKCRRQSLESDFTRKCQEAIDRITVITKTTEHELKSLSGTVKHIAENISVPAKEETFFIPAEDMADDEQFVFVGDTSNNVDVPNFGTADSAENLTEEAGTEVVSVQHHVKKENFLDRLMKLLFKDKHKKTIISMLEQGYKEEQITFVLKCMEEGMSERDIDEIAAPELSVEHMELLKRIKRREQDCDGIR